jgi:hypothetical protein
MVGSDHGANTMSFHGKQGLNTYRLTCGIADALPGSRHRSRQSGGIENPALEAPGLGESIETAVAALKCGEIS